MTNAEHKVDAIPKGFRAATPYLIVRDAERALAYYAKVFGAVERGRLTDPDGKIVHAEMQIGDSRLMLADEMPGFTSPLSLGGTPVIISLYVPDVDAVVERAVAEGATVMIPVGDQFYGDRAGRIKDPFGHLWIVGTHKEDVSPEEMERRAHAWKRKEK